MRIEHFGYNVTEPQKMALWYRDQLGFTIERAGEKPPYAHFLTDETGGMMIEIYHNTACAVPDYSTQDPLLLHLALVSGNVQADVERLTAAGATIADPVKTTPAGDTLCMLRDPWGFALQLCGRANPMVR